MQFSSQKRKILIITIGISIIIGLLFTQQKVKNFFYFISEPAQKFLWQTGKKISTPVELIFELRELKNKFEEMSIYNQRLLSKNTQLRVLKRENEILRKALEIDLKKDFQLTLTELIGKDISQDSLFISKGLKDGLFKGMPVITEGKILIGKITEVSENFSTVSLISHLNSSFDVKIQEKEIAGVMKGKGNFQLILDFILKDQEIKEGDLVETTSLGGIFPKGILVGKIQKILSSDIEPFQQAEVSPFFDINKLEMVFIITKY